MASSLLALAARGLGRRVGAGLNQTVQRLALAAAPPPPSGSGSVNLRRSLAERLGAAWRAASEQNSPWPPLAIEFASSSSSPGGAPSGPQQRVAAAVAAGMASRGAAMKAGVAAASQAAASAAEAAGELFGWSVLNKQKRMFRGVHTTLNPSLWRWYHRHGYWATRRKNIDFGTKRPHRYHQVVGDGKKGDKYARRFCQWWMDKSYYKPMKNYCRF
ncbi:unnamed protein product [Polarella glacialis]|uniref:Uncharacterized protein n=1 Tax=Polarella glacialis TaxID=89957 RepID=A0A813IBB0_POLGL|nr:unnamed protein product [Polarella glacialis]CAE8646831.1 unnamed protein product [Polarella glacialis]CAE8647532.1 unnamed protein product [Polarella glacialis]